jgi:molybdopterin molybdotransferase
MQNDEWGIARMIAVDEALALVLSEVPLGRRESVPLARSLGRVLAVGAVSDVDSPPHDKSIVDGFALRSADLADGVGEFDVVEAIMAGMTPTKAIRPGEAARIMTGAPVPDGADCVAMVERSSPISGSVERVRIEDASLRADQNIVRRAAVMRAGEAVIEPGTLLRSMEIGLLAEIGRAEVNVYRQPTVAVLSTGNELVPCDERPRAGQIRNSNGPMLVAAVTEAGGIARDLGIGRDDPVQLRESIRAGLDADMLLVSGGVSMGDLDLAPALFRELGIEEVFHKVRLKPGKPLWFGVRRGERPTLVFGLPGNPVSSLVCFQLFVAPAMRRFQGIAACEPLRQRARLTQPFQQRGERDTYAPSQAQWSSGGLEIQTLPSLGSGDLRSLANANALAFFPAGNRQYSIGETIEVVPLTSP